MTRVVVIGGGIAGLAAAHALAARGAAVTVLEAADRVGGKLRLDEIGGMTVDVGAEAFLRRRPEGRDLVAEVGLGDRLVSPQTSQAAVWARGRLRRLPAGTVMGVPSRPGSLRGLLSPVEVARVAVDPLLPGPPPGDDVAVGDWVGRRLGRPVVERLLDPLLGGVYAGRADELSLAATIPQLPRDRRSALAAARAVAPGPLSSEPVFATLRGGLGLLPSAVAAAIEGGGGRILTRRAARRLERGPAGWRVVHGPTTDQQLLEADAVVVAVPAAPAARLLADTVPAAARELGVVDTASLAIITMSWPAAGSPQSAGSGYLVPAATGRPVKAVTFSSTKWAHLALPETTLVRCSIGRHREVEQLQRDDADLVTAAVAELTSYAGFTGRPAAAVVTRWGGALPQYAVGHRDRVDRIRRAVAAVPGLAVCGAVYDGVGVPACIRTGQDAAAALVPQHTAAPAG